MATAFGSIATASNGGANISSFNAAKPSGLAVGDLMLVIMSALDGDLDQFSRTGWSLYDSDFFISGGRTVSYAVFVKVADSGDVAAANFTFTSTGTHNAVIGGTLRITGDSFDGTSNLTQNDRDTDDDVQASSVTFLGGITPSNADSLLIMGMATGGGVGNTPSVTGYSVVTDNPTWTERMEVVQENNSGASEAGLALATASRTQTTATGNYTLNLSGGSVVNGIGFIIAIFESEAVVDNAILFGANF